jgi:galactonate dehydratase
VIGKDPRDGRRLSVDLQSRTRFAPGGYAAQAIAAIENACLDIAAKQLGVPVHALFGGALRASAPIYWSHCGMYRAARPDLCDRLGLAPVRTLDDIEALGREVRRSGCAALKTNLLRFGGEGPRMHNPGFTAAGAGPAMEATPDLVADTVALLQAFARGAGKGVDLILDANFNFRAPGFIRMARALEPLGLRWMEADLPDPATLAAVRRSARTPIGSLETVFGRRAFAAFLEAQAVDVAIIDVTWNGLMESLAMAAIAEAFEVSVATHTYAGPLASVMSAHLAMAIPNLSLMEYDMDGSSWRDAFLTAPPRVEQGFYTPPGGPGWGCEVNEAVLRAHALADGGRS